MNPYDYEAIVLGTVMRYPEQAAPLALPVLTHDKFVYGTSITYDSKPDHMRLWQAITKCFLSEKKHPTMMNVLSRMMQYDEDYTAYVQSLIDRLYGHYRIFEFDYEAFIDAVNEVDKNGIIWRMAMRAKELGKIVDAPEQFAQYVSGVEDVHDWANQQISRFHIENKPDDMGYEHISVATDELLTRLDLLERGDISLVLSNGIPVLMQHDLFPPGTLAMIHGESSSGKSAFTHQVQLGTALSLVRDNIKGCVTINTLEMQAWQIVQRNAALLSGFNTRRLKDRRVFGTEDYQNFKQWIEFCRQLPIYIDNTKAITTSLLKYRLDGIHASDYGPVWQTSSDYTELFADDDGTNKEQKVSNVGRNHFDVAKQLGASVLLISQSTQGQGDYTARIAGASGLRYSQGLRQAADIIVELWNPIELKNAGLKFTAPEGLNTSQAWVLIEKNRDGAKGAFPMNWEAEYTRFLDPDMNRDIAGVTVFESLKEVQDKLGYGHLQPINSTLAVEGVF